nr:hypothetical protein [Kribbella sp. ALI-6-A]
MPDALAAVLLRRRRLVDGVRLTPPVRRTAWQWLKRPLTTQAGLGALQAELIQRGFLMSVALYRYCAGLNPLALTGFGQSLVALLDQESGADAQHVPLFRGFPESVPGNTETFYVNRVFARLLQEPEQPCVLCGEVGIRSHRAPTWSAAPAGTAPISAPVHCACSGSTPTTRSSSRPSTTSPARPTPTVSSCSVSPPTPQRNLRPASCSPAERPCPSSIAPTSPSCCSTRIRPGFRRSSRCAKPAPSWSRG